VELISLADLLDLQGIDSAIDRLLEQRADLPELEQYRQAAARSDEIDTRYAEASDVARQLLLDVDKSEGELGLLETKLEQTELRLYAGGMSARETANYQAEVESLRRQRGDMESAVLELLDRREQADAEQESIEAERESANRDQKRLEALISEAWNQIDGEIARKESAKLEVVPLIDQDVLELYESIRSGHDGVGVGRLDSRVCGACHLSLSPAEEAQVKRDFPPRCIHCGRILVI